MDHVHIRVGVGTVKLEFRGRRAFYDRAVEPLVRALDPEGETNGPAKPAGPVWAPESPPHFVQFVGQVGERAAGVDQQVMAFAFYRWNFEKAEQVESAEVAAFLRSIHQDVPEDLPERLANLAESKRFLEPATERGWKLTNKGVNYVKNRLLAAVS